MAFALVMTAAMFSGRAMAQTPLPCSGHAYIANGRVVVENLTPPAGVDSVCEVLATPTGVELLNGGNTHAPDGIDATHEGAGGGHTS
jgi:hypothetical protein